MLRWVIVRGEGCDRVECLCCVSLSKITPIVDRALQGGIGAPHQQVEPAGPVVRDLLADVVAVLHSHDRLKAIDVAARLREIAPD